MDQLGVRQWRLIASTTSRGDGGLNETPSATIHTDVPSRFVAGSAYGSVHRLEAARRPISTSSRAEKSNRFSFGGSSLLVHGCRSISMEASTSNEERGTKNEEPFHSPGAFALIASA
jgi:hypothetical protein